MICIGKTKCTSEKDLLPSAIPCRLASALLFICSYCCERLTSAFMAAFKALNACSTELRNGLYGGFLILSSELEQRTCALFVSVLFM